MLKKSLIFVLVIWVYCLTAREGYCIEPSAKLEPYSALINQIFNEAYKHSVPGDFYLTNITRIIYYLMLALAEKKIYIELKGFWREQVTKSDYLNHLYIYYSWENPRHDPC